MARKPAKMYRQVKGPAYTRRKYIGGVPNNRIMQFHTGNRRAAETGGFPVVIELRVDNACQIRHTALEAARVICNSTIRNASGAQGYALRVHTYPHHVLRENKRPLEQVRTVSRRACAARSARTSVRQPVCSAVSAS